MQLCVWQQWIVAATVSSSHSILPPISLSVSHFSSVLFCLPCLSLRALTFLLLTAELPLGADQQSVACAMLTLETHDTLQISSLADTSSSWSEQDKFQPLLSNNCSKTTTGSAHTFWVMHLRCHFKNLPSSKQSKTCFHWPSLKDRVRKPN